LVCVGLFAGQLRGVVLVAVAALYGAEVGQAIVFCGLSCQGRTDDKKRSSVLLQPWLPMYRETVADLRFDYLEGTTFYTEHGDCLGSGVALFCSQLPHYTARK
jgi:hypothetical protein